jgi:SPP1 family predicted phage head-tail adaptor
VIGAGDLDRRATIQRATVAPDAFNEPIETWASVATVWASKRDVSDGERFRSDQTIAGLTTRFVVRHSSVTATITPKDRLVCEGRTYDIHGVKEVHGTRRFLEISAAWRSDA